MMNKLPDFIIAGVQKSGTTYLDSILRNHPSIFMPRRTTEYSYFDDRRIFEAKSFSWYQRLFDNQNQTSICGQTSVDSLFDKDALRRIKEAIPSVKLIIILRHPIQRTRSHYWHQVKMALEHKDFEDAIRAEEKRTSLSYYNLKKYAYIGRSKYSAQFDNLNEIFDSKNVKVIPFEYFIQDELYYTNDILRFIGLPEIDSLDGLIGEESNMNSSKLPPEIVRKYSYLFRYSLVGRTIFKCLLKKKRPPKLSDTEKGFLEDLLKEDIEFYTQLCETHRA